MLTAEKSRASRGGQMCATVWFCPAVCFPLMEPAEFTSGERVTKLFNYPAKEGGSGKNKRIVSPPLRVYHFL